MFKKNPKHRQIFLIFFIVVMIINSVMSFYQFADTKEGMKLTGGILFGVMAIIFIDDLYQLIKEQKRIKEEA